ncbi:hypothetical protein Tco_0761821 [Tanacetum coccineum]
MTTLKFVDSHNMVAFLSKPTESKGFEQIVDFLNAHPIKNALAVNPTIYTSCIEQFWATVKAKTIDGEVQLQALVDGKQIIITESTVMSSPKRNAWNEFSSTMASAIICLAINQKFNFLKFIFESMMKNLDNVGNFFMYPRNMRRVGKGFSGRETPLFQTMVVQDQAKIEDVAVYKELDDSLVRVATTTSSLEAEQGSGNINKTRSKATPNESSSLRTTSGGGPRVLDLEKTKTTQAEEIGRINAIVADEDITLVNDQDDADMFDVNTLTGDEVLAEQEVADKDVNLIIDEVTLAQALAALKSVKPKVKANVVEEPSVPVSAASTKVSAATTTTTATIPTSRKGIVITELGTSIATTKISLRRSQAKVQDKGKGILVEEPLKPKKKDLIRLDEEIASKLQAEFDEEERLAREKDEANVALTEEWDDIQAKVDADYQLAQRLQAEEQEQFTTEQKATLFKELLEQRRKHFAAKRAEEKRNKPPTQAQQRKIMCTYLKNMEGKKPKDLKNKSFDSIQKMFDRAFKRVNTFVDFRTDLVEVSSKRAGDELKQEVTKKQKVDDIQETTKVDNDQETAKIKEFIVWKNQQDYRVLEWKLYDYYGVHFLRMQHMQIYMLVEKRYPLTPATITDMLNKKLQCDHFSEMAYQLLKLLTKQLKN